MPAGYRPRFGDLHMTGHWTLVLAVVGGGFCAALAAMMLLTLLLQRRKGATLASSVRNDAVFLFDDDYLVDASDAGRALLRGASRLPGMDGAAPWKLLEGFVAPRFPGFAAQMARLASDGPIELASSSGGNLKLRAEWVAGLARITVLDASGEGARIVLDHFSHAAREEELAMMRETMNTAPVLIWRQSVDGALTWANRTYLETAGRAALNWPLPVLFPLLGADDAGTVRRMQITPEGGDGPHWFDCHVRLQQGGILAFALPADTAAAAEQARRSFIQTLTKTFADLPVGLAIFGRDRRLQVFNPALTDLTTLGADFLSAQPPLEAFLDQLRERRVLPEPRDYRNWRKQILKLEKDAATGQYQDTWCLPGGETYRVTGRPHPDGALALLIEDISDETSLSRRFRAEIETGRAVIDAMAEAVAVFSPSGTLLMTNTAYARLWGSDPAGSATEHGLKQVLAVWREMTLPNPLWDDITGFVTHTGAREPWRGPVYMRDGQMLTVSARPVNGGNTLVSFAGAAQQDAAPVGPPTRLRRIG